MGKHNRKYELETNSSYDNVANEFEDEDFHEKVKFSYTHVMRAYSIYCNNKTKQIERFRTIFFWGILGAFCVFSLISILFLILDFVYGEGMVPAIVTFLSNILIFPVIIAKYLFNHKEDKEFLDLYKEYFADIIKKETEEIKARINKEGDKKTINCDVEFKNDTNLINLTSKIKNITNKTN